MNKEIKKITDYFSDYDGWFCEVEDENGECCGEIIENTRKALQEHLKSKHKIEVELK